MYLFMIFRFIFEEIDPVALAIHNAVISGELDKDHIFYKLVQDILHCTKDTNHRFSQDSKSFLATLEYHGREKVI